MHEATERVAADPSADEMVVRIRDGETMPDLGELMDIHGRAVVVIGVDERYRLALVRRVDGRT